MIIATSKENRMNLYSKPIFDKIQNSLDCTKMGASIDEITRYKAYIQDRLLNNTDVLYALHNERIENKVKNNNILKLSVQYLSENIFPCMKVPDVQSNVKNFILFDVGEQKYASDDLARITKVITFRVLTYEDDMETDFGISRVDLLGLLINDMFEGLSALGTVWEKTSDTPKATTNDYFLREITYKASSPNNLSNRLKNGIERFR